MRPACEELIWIKYLDSIPPILSEKLVMYIAQDELYKSLHAQDDVAGRTATKLLGLLPHLEKAERCETDRRKGLSSLGHKLHWPNRQVENGSLPPISWLAKKTDEQETYKLIYHATSRFVHFSASELLRRAWGNPYTKSVSITSRHFHDYWGYFSLYWGLNLFLDTLIVLHSILGVLSDAEGEAILEAAQQIGKMGKPPIITAEELAWPI